MQERRRRQTSFTRRCILRKATEDERRVQRQAFAGLLWTKQIYLFDVNKWLEGDNPLHAACVAELRSATGTGGT